MADEKFDRLLEIMFEFKDNRTNLKMGCTSLKINLTKDLTVWRVILIFWRCANRGMKRKLIESKTVGLASQLTHQKTSTIISMNFIPIE